MQDMKQLGLQEIQQIELNILLSFQDFCNVHHLRFYLTGGTLLGAIRHKGFIPWDDDIDICMPRKDYEFAIKNFDGWQNNLKVKSNYLHNFWAPFSKIVDSNTKIDIKYIDNDLEINLWIDIFPVDGLPDDINKVRKMYREMTFYRTILGLTRAKLGEGSTPFRKYSKYILKPLANLYGRKNILRKMEQLAARYPYDDCQYVGSITWGVYWEGERMLKTEYETPVEVDFEGYKFPIYSCWDHYLKGMYHDYMQLPPVEQRKTHITAAYLLEDGDK